MFHKKQSNLVFFVQIRAVRPAVRYGHPCRRGKVLSAQGNSSVPLQSSVNQTRLRRFLYLRAKTMDPPMYSYEHAKRCCNSSICCQAPHATWILVALQNILHRFLRPFPIPYEFLFCCMTALHVACD
jgi:hypothetical protein